MGKTNLFSTMCKNSDVGRKISKDARSKIILTTRVQLARNLSDHKFGSTSSSQEKNDVLNLIIGVASGIRELSDYKFYTVNKLTKVQRRLLIEKHLMSPEMTSRMQGKGVLVKSCPCNHRKSVSIMINGEDHLRIQCAAPGLNVRESYKEIMKIEKKLEKKLTFAFNSKLGYLTACPVNLGTALRISVIAHLPGLVMSSKITDFINNITNIGCRTVGYFGENSEIVGNLFQISRRATLGRSEEDIVEEMNAICLNIVEEEEKARQTLKANHLVDMEDSVYRSYGVLKYAKMLSYEESLELLSMIELGMELGIVKNVKKFNFSKLVNIIGNSHIMLSMKKDKKLREDEVDFIRANVIREKILKRIR